MSDFEQGDDTSGTESAPARRRAEERVRQILANAMVQAETYCRDANSRALDVIETHRQRALEACRRIEAAVPPGSATLGAKRLRRTPGELPQREEIALRAYFKAEQRNFQAGQETDDWLTAERELLLGHRDWRG
jgi:hypothetical protein